MFGGAVSARIGKSPVEVGLTQPLIRHIVILHRENKLVNAKLKDAKIFVSSESRLSHCTALLQLDKIF